MNKTQAIENVSNSVASLFTKEDVISLIEKIQMEQKGFDLEKLKELSEKITSLVRNTIGNADLDVENPKFEINYDNRVELESYEQITLDGDSKECFADSLVDEIETIFQDFEDSETETDSETDSETETETEN
jgi:hypothetical protein